MLLSATVLVADDHEIMRHMICSLLSQNNGWKVYEAQNGKVALEEVRRMRPDVAVLDIVMPGMNGIEAASKIRKDSPETKVILISSHFTPEQATVIGRFFSDGPFIQKADLVKSLIPAINRLIWQ